jgi:hypothetical protein
MLSFWLRKLKSSGAGTQFLSDDGTYRTVAGGGGGGNAVSVTVDFGSTFSHYASTVVVGQAWVTGTSKIVATPVGTMEPAVLQFSFSVSDLVVGTGFTVNVFAPFMAKGTYTFSCIGV